MKLKTIIFFTDCNDANALSRVFAHLSARLSKARIQCLGINTWQEVALNIFNVLEVWKKSDSKGNVVVGNIAPREDKTWQNGAPFCFANIEGNTVIATPACFAVLVDQQIVSAENIYQTDISKVCKKLLKKKDADEISSTQFRSLWYVPRLIKWISKGKKIPLQALPQKHIPSIYPSVFLIDNFGNLKLSFSRKQLCEMKEGKSKMKIGDKIVDDIPKVFDYLSQVSEGDPAFVTSSGGSWVELLVNGSSAKDLYSTKVGDEVSFI